MRFITFCILLISLPRLLEGTPYSVDFTGIKEKKTIEFLKSVSLLINDKEKLPPKEPLLRKKAQSDAANFERALQSLAYYDPEITYDLDLTQKPVKITFKIDTGPLFTLSECRVLPDDLNISADGLGLKLSEPAYPEKILQAEEILIKMMHKKGYPFAKIDRRQIIADDEKGKIFVTFNLDSGPLLFFGKTTITGLRAVADCLVRQKIAWKEGAKYDPDLIDKTSADLEETTLFSLVKITPDENAVDNLLPINILLKENKRRSIAAGAVYSTQLGPGVTFEWENRNFDGFGHQFSVDADLLLIRQNADLRYLIENCRGRNFDLTLQSELVHENYRGFENSSLRLTGLIERRISDQGYLSFGASLEQLQIADSDNDGSYSLIKTPLALRYDNSDDFLDPSRGFIFYFNAVPAYQFIGTPDFYMTNFLSVSFYRHFDADKKLVLALKAQLGSIVGSSRKKIPPSDRFYAGSETTIRGYNYYTVSPLNSHRDPLGGRSLMIYTLEGRYRLSSRLGAVLFYDIGNVYSSVLPGFNEKLLSSIGMGVRYYTAVGPLRLDVALPLQRRRHIDRPLQFYLSVGQAF